MNILHLKMIVMLSTASHLPDRVMRVSYITEQTHQLGEK